MPGPEQDLKTYQTECQGTNHADASTANEMGSFHNNKKPKISTLVFMDLESTGLPSDVGRRNVQITEMCMVAVDRNSFEVDKKLRVLNKISLCVRPRFPISPDAMMITGLYNDALENQVEFDDSVPRLLEYFFRRLQKPICLLAHNGNRFDFPVLQAELKRLNFTLGSDIVCADTLVAFRTICQVQKQVVAAEEAEKKIKEKMEAERKAEKTVNNILEMEVDLVKSCTSTTISDEDIDSLLSEDLESFSCINDLVTYNKSSEPGLTEILAKVNGSGVNASSEKKTVQSKEFLSPSQNEKTPQKNQVSLHPDEPKNVRKRKILDPTFLPKNLYNKKKILPAKRNLFPEPNHENTSCLEIHKITRFSLQNLYNHFFHENPPNSHYAEVDVISLSKVCQKISSNFLEWIDQNSVAFSTIDALW